MRIPVILLAGVVLGGSVILPVRAAGYHPEQKVIFKGKQKIQLRDAIQAFNSLPELGRQAMIANRLDLYFSEAGNSRYNSYFRWPDPGGMFVGADGNVRGWHQVRDSVPPVQWNEADRKLWDVGHNAVFPAVAKEVTAVIYETAKVIVNAMPPELRDSWLAEEAGLLYSATGGKAYGRGFETTTTDSGREVKHRKLAGLYDLRFVDAEGKEHAFGTVLTTHAKLWERRRKILYLCIQYTSRKEILALFSKEVAALTKSKETFSPQNGTSTPAPAAPPAEAPTPADERTAMGDTKQPSAPPQPAPASDAPQSAPNVAQPATAREPKEIPTSAPPIAPPSSQDLPTVAILKQIPVQARTAWIAEHLGMCFMDDNSKAVDSQNWVRGGAKYIGTDGQPHDFWTSQRKASNRWNEMNSGVKTQDDLVKVLSAFPEQVEQMTLQAAKAHLQALPELMRDAWLCELGGLLYIPGNSRSAYTNGINTLRNDGGFTFGYRAADSGRGCFRDTKGIEHKLSERNEYWNTCSKRWNILQLCAALIGPNMAVEALPEVMAELRKHNTVSPDYKPITPLIVACDTSEAEAYFRTVPRNQQDAWLSDIMGTCFLPDGSSSRDPEQNLKREALYLDRTGKVCRFYDNHDSRVWQKLSSLLPKGQRILVDKFPKEVEALALAAIKYQLPSMPQVMRDSWLCVNTGLCYLLGKDGDPYDKSEPSTFTTDNGNSHQTKRIKYEAYFTDTTGTRYQMVDRKPYWKEVGMKWAIATVCLKYCKLSDVIEAFGAEMATLRKNYEAATGKKAPADALPPSSGEGAGSRKTGMGTQWF